MTKRKREIPREPRKINPSFPIPEGLYGFEYGTKRNGSSPAKTLQDEWALIDDQYTEGEDPGTPEIPETTDSMVIISQTLRTTVTGAQVVDLVAEVDDVDGITKYDIRLTKI